MIFECRLKRSLIWFQHSSSICLQMAWIWSCFHPKSHKWIEALGENRCHFQNYMEAKVLVAETWNFEWRNCKLSSFRHNFQIWLIFISFWMVFLCYVPFEKNHTVHSYCFVMFNLVVDVAVKRCYLDKNSCLRTEQKIVKIML